MAKKSTDILVVCAILTILLSPSAAGGGGHRQQAGWFPTASTAECGGSIAECMMMGGEEFEMDSEINRRILATTRYISYGALRRNTVPCSRRGASYYNCRPGAQANPYSRGCSRITRCRR
ncbi:hypothetical protein ACSBR2_013550 [Camellia fascicularis]